MRSLKVIALTFMLVIPSSTLCAGAARPLEQDAALFGTQADRQLVGWLEAYNTGELNVLRNFIAGHFEGEALEKRPAAQRAATGIATFNLTRQLKLHSILRSADYEIVALCQSVVTEAWFNIKLQVSPRPPHGIINLTLDFASRPSDVIPRRRLNQAQIIKELDTYLAKLVSADMLSGVVLVAKDGKPVFERAYGLDASNAPNRIDTSFDLASLSKMFTSVAVAQLAEQGKLSYDDSIIKFLPDYPNQRAARKITIHHLLTHTSGLVDYSDKKEYRPARQADANRFKALRDWFPFFANDPLSFQPGEKNEYSNSGFIVLGVIIEKVSGQSYFNYVREHIFKPAGMSNTSITVATGNSAGGGSSTASDLLKFAAALQHHKLLNAKYTRIILTPKVYTGEGEAYGYGFEISQVKGKRIVGHSGGGGVDNKLDMYLDDGYTVITLAKPYAAQNITRKLKELIIQGG